MDETLEIHVDIGEDWVGQLFWLDEYGDAIPATDPVLLDVKDGNGQIVFRFATGANPATDPAIVVAGYTGFFQMSIPSAWTVKLVPGRYVFDLWAAVADSAAPFAHQQQKVCEGVVVAHSRVTRLETVDIVQLEAP